MSTRYNDGSHYENHQLAAELRDNAAHTHRVAAETRGQQDHETGQERTRQAQEHSQEAFLSAQQVQHSASMFSHEDTARLAYRLWEERGRPEGSPEQDWHRATAQLRARK